MRVGRGCQFRLAIKAFEFMDSEFAPNMYKRQGKRLTFRVHSDSAECKINEDA